MSKFVIKNGSNGHFYFVLVAKNGQIILSSQSYTSKAGCIKGIESVKANAADVNNYKEQESGNNKYYFNLIAANGEIIGSSETYESKTGRQSGIESVITNAPVASIMQEDE